MVLPAEVTGLPSDLTVPPNTKVALSSAEAQQPNPPKTPATAKATEKGAEANSGEADKVTASDGLMYQIVGIVIVIFGLLIWLAKKKSISILSSATGTGGFFIRAAAVLPYGSGAIIAAAGVGFMILPWLLREYGELVAASIFIPLLVYGVWWIFNLITNKSKKSDPLDQTK